VDARNEYGYSDISTEIAVYTSGMPEAPPNVVTADEGLAGANIQVSWGIPFDNGAPILYYKILFVSPDSSTGYSELVNCDG